MSKISAVFDKLPFYLFFLFFFISIFFSSFVSADAILIINSVLIIFIFLQNMKIIVKRNQKKALLSLLLIVMMTVSALINSGSIGSVINNSIFLIGVLVFSNIKLDKVQYTFLMIMSALAWAYSISLSFTVWGSFMSGYSVRNPNVVAMIIFFTQIIILQYLKKHDRHWLMSAIAILSFISIYFTKSRTIMIADIFYLLIAYVPLLTRYFVRFRVFVGIVFMIFGSLFPAIYLDMYDNGIKVDISPSNEKMFYSGREVIWGDAIDALNTVEDGWLFGVGSHYSATNNEQLIDDTHNWYMTVLYSFGLLVFLLYFLFYVFLVKREIDVDLVVLYLAFLIGGFTEAIGSIRVTQILFFICIVVSRYGLPLLSTSIKKEVANV